ncbi:hypothetical protein [Sphingobacterium bambusae]|uniref:Uncharacterized protein n=2 Tax=Sphingobacterium bambusae TaxID=662858 RepID=A0ABW6BCN9_9SPHI
MSSKRNWIVANRFASRIFFPFIAAATAYTLWKYFRNEEDDPAIVLMLIIGGFATTYFLTERKLKRL